MSKSKQEVFELFDRVISLKDIPVDKFDQPIEMTVKILPQGGAIAFNSRGAKVSYTWFVKTLF